MKLDAKDWIALVSILATLTIALVTLFVNRRREKLQQERDDRQRQDQQAREDSLREEQRKREVEREKTERTYIPQVEFNVDCNFYGPHQDFYLAEILLTVHNKGRVKQEFKDVTLRIRGIEENQPLMHWKGREPRLYFPIKLVDDVPVVPASASYFFAEPGEEHLFTYVTKIPSSINYVLVYSTFSYENGTSHDAERVFPVRVS